VSLGVPYEFQPQWTRCVEPVQVDPYQVRRYAVVDVDPEKVIGLKVELSDDFTGAEGYWTP
jgi:hypothetical protein